MKAGEELSGNRPEAQPEGGSKSEGDRGGIILKSFHIDPCYATGEYFSNPSRHSADSQHKAQSFLKVILRFAAGRDLVIRSYVDVGCGSGAIVGMVADKLREQGFPLGTVKGYDVSPHIKDVKKGAIQFVHGDFCASDESVDLVTLFDVFEHITDPVQFLKSVSRRCKMVGLHVPLEYSIREAMNDNFLSLIRNPGHLVFMDIVSALNLLAFSGLKVVDYEYSLSFLSEPKPTTVRGWAGYAVRSLLAKISPWLLSKTLGGVSIMVLALTPKGIQEVSLSGYKR